MSKKAIVVGGVAGVGTAAAISSSFIGASGAAMTEGLAAMGLQSMATGIGVTAFAPLAVAGLVGYGVFKLFKD